MLKTKKRKKLMLFIIIGIIMLGVIIYTFYPRLVSFIYKTANVLTPPSEETYSDKPVPIVPVETGSDPYSDTDKSYSEKYWNEIENSKKKDYATTNEILKNIEKNISKSKYINNNSSSLNVYGKYIISYTINSVNYSDTLENNGIDPSQILIPGIYTSSTDSKELSAEYSYLIATITLENIGDSSALDIGTNIFTFCLIDETHAIYSSEFIYGTLQPGYGTHKYFIPELDCGESLETKIVFIIPNDEQFDNYDRYMYVNPGGTGDYDPELGCFIPVNNLID